MNECHLLHIAHRWPQGRRNKKNLWGSQFYTQLVYKPHFEIEYFFNFFLGQSFFFLNYVNACYSIKYLTIYCTYLLFLCMIFSLYENQNSIKMPIELIVKNIWKLIKQNRSIVKFFEENLSEKLIGRLENWTLGSKWATNLFFFCLSIKWRVALKTNCV